MRDAKSGRWFETHPHRALANNSAVYNAKPEFPLFLKEVHSLYSSFSGERGFFSREAAKKIAARNGRRDVDHDFGTNPCSEIILRSSGVCNLSEVIIRPDDTLASLKKKVEIAAIFGTLQSTLTGWRYVRRSWIDNLERERLLGISFSGICDHEVMSGRYPESFGKTRKWLEELRDHAEKVNEEWAERLGINPSHSVSCVKPSGTVSQLVDSSSGIHPRYAKHYIRRVRQSLNDPITQFLEELYRNLDFDAAQTQLEECVHVLAGDYFLSDKAQEFQESCRLLIFETYCRIHKHVKLSMSHF